MSHPVSRMQAGLARKDAKAWKHALRQMVFAVAYPRLDVEVSKKMNHLLKARGPIIPASILCRFCSGTGRRSGRTGRRVGDSRSWLRRQASRAWTHGCRQVLVSDTSVAVL